MTDKAISPLRRRTDRGHDDPPAQPQDALPIYPPCQKVCRFSGPVCRQGHRRGCPSLSVMAGLERDVGRNRQRQRHCPAVLLQGHTETPRSCRGAHLDPRASPPARCSEPGGGRSAARCGDEHQAQSDPELGLCHRPASLGGRIAQAHRSDRKSTRLNSSHLVISYAVFCLKKKKKKLNHHTPHTTNPHHAPPP